MKIHSPGLVSKLGMGCHKFSPCLWACKPFGFGLLHVCNPFFQSCLNNVRVCDGTVDFERTKKKTTAGAVVSLFKNYRLFAL